jgi:O-antigen ligase/polysaccharide polymerase Wzy-like membrane protein
MPDRLAPLTGRLRGLVPRPAVRDRWEVGTSRGAAARALTWASLVLVAAVTGVVVATSGKIGLGVAAAVLVLGIFVTDPILLAVIALPASLLLLRVGGATTNLSTADLVVFVAGLACLLQIRWRDARFLKQFLAGIVWYEAVLLLVVLVNPNRYDIVEWFHRWSYVGASALVGWVIASNGRVRPAFRAFLYGAAMLGVAAMLDAVASHFQPAQFGLYQKNAIGDILWVAIAVAQINPPWLGVGRREARVCKYLCIGGLLASYSRQGVIVLILALGVAVLRNPEVRRRSKMMLLGAVPLVIGLYYSFTYAARTNPKFNSVSIRVSQLDAALHVWHMSPLFGEGMRFYNLPQFVSVTAPPNVLIDNLASTGIVGSLAFFFLVFVTTRTMARLPAAFGTLGLAILVAHYVDGLFDIFWIGASSTIPFIIAGVCLGMADSERTRTGLEGDTVGEPGTAFGTGFRTRVGAVGSGVGERPATGHTWLSARARRTVDRVVAGRWRLLAPASW